MFTQLQKTFSLLACSYFGLGVSCVILQRFVNEMPDMLLWICLIWFCSLNKHTSQTHVDKQRASQTVYVCPYVLVSGFVQMREVESSERFFLYLPSLKGVHCTTGWWVAWPLCGTPWPSLCWRVATEKHAPVMRSEIHHTLLHECHTKQRDSAHSIVLCLQSAYYILIMHNVFCIMYGSTWIRTRRGDIFADIRSWTGGRANLFGECCKYEISNLPNDFPL